MRGDDAADAAFEQLKPHDENQRADAKRAEVLDAPVPEGMLTVNGLLGNADADERHNAACRVGQVVDRVRRDCQRAGQRADNDFRQRKQNVRPDANSGRERPQPLADGLVGRVFAGANQALGKAHHDIPPNFIEKICQRLPNNVSSGQTRRH